MGVLPSVPVGNRLQLSFPSGELFPEDGSFERYGHDIMSRVAEDLDSSYSFCLLRSGLKRTEQVRMPSR